MHATTPGGRRPGEPRPVRPPVRLSASDRLTLAFFGIAVGGAVAWAAWWLVAKGETLVGISVAGLAVVGLLALWSAVRDR